uniref:LRRCT domain-containing protein n=1 Tax=Timema cristinae TaxID=61476 RepID=A0A7R9H2Z8_TIMCR|nr:unnamed protein product [Timema cristinae]
MTLKLAVSSPTDGGRSLGLMSWTRDMTPLGTIVRNKNGDLLPRDALLGVMFVSPARSCPEMCSCSAREALKVVNQHQAALCKEIPPPNLSRTITSLQLIDADIKTISNTTLKGVSHYLISLDMSLSGIETLDPRAFDDSPYLTSLHLSNNRLKKILSGTFRTCTLLRELYLDGNGLKEVADGVFAKLDNLEYLYLERNQLVHIPGKLPPTLVILDISGNSIGPIVTEHFYQNSLKSLDLCGNLLKSVSLATFSTVRNLQSLCIGDHEVNLPLDTSTHLPHLTNLTLQGDAIGKAVMDGVTRGEIAKLGALETLAIMHYEVTNLRFLNNLTRLQNVKLQYVSVTGDLDLEAAFLNKLFLLRVNLDGSAGLASALLGDPRVVTHLSRLVQLSLKDTGLIHLAPHNLPLVDHLYVDISGNPLRCDCRIKWINDKVYNLLSSQNTKCASPEVYKNALLKTVAEEMNCSADNTTPSPGGSTSSSIHATSDNDHTTVYIVVGCVLGVLVIIAVVLAVVYRTMKNKGGNRITPHSEIPGPGLQQVQAASSKDHLIKK